MPRELKELTGGTICEVDGMTETTLIATVTQWGGKAKPGTVGVPVSDTDVRIVDPAFYREVRRVQGIHTVGRARAREISLPAHRLGARKALEIGLVNEICPDEATLVAKAHEMAAEIAGNPLLAVQGAKEVFLYDEEVFLDESLNHNAARSSMIVPSENLADRSPSCHRGARAAFVHALGTLPSS